MDNALIESMNAEALRCYPNEACGLVIAKGKKPVLVPCENTASDKRNRFTIAPQDYADAAQQGEVVAIWHSHVDEPATPSEADKAGCEASELPWFITGIRKREEGFVYEGPVLHEPCGYESPYLERPYVFGVHDCWSLVRDFYKREFGIVLGDYQRVDQFWAKGLNFFVDNYENEGMVRVDGKQPERGDLFIIQTGSALPNHIAVYIGDDQILHHCHGRLSARAIYGGYWQKHTVIHLRHKSKC